MKECFCVIKECVDFNRHDVLYTKYNIYCVYVNYKYSLYLIKSSATHPGTRRPKNEL